jgi:hypothetical protein
MAAEIGTAPTTTAASDASTTALLSPTELEQLVGPIALYADELLAIVLPASTYPLEIVQAARYLEQHKQSPDIEPSKGWDESILGLLNYPEVIDKMNDGLDWTGKLGEAVVDQQADVMDAVQHFRNQAYTAGNLESSKQTVIVQEKETIRIESASPEVICVPSYQPTIVIVRQPRSHILDRHVRWRGGRLRGRLARPWS